jgi:hypothetical protein
MEGMLDLLAGDLNIGQKPAALNFLKKFFPDEPLCPFLIYAHLCGSFLLRD